MIKIEISFSRNILFYNVPNNDSGKYNFSYPYPTEPFDITDVAVLNFKPEKQYKYLEIVINGRRFGI